MASQVNLPEDLQSQMEAAARAEGKTVDELAAEVLQHHLAQKSLERFQRQGDARRRGMCDEQIENIVEQAIIEYRKQ